MAAARTPRGARQHPTEPARRQLGMMPSTPRARVAIRTQPRARSDELVALRDGVLLVRVTAPPVDGRANDAVCRLLAEALGVRPSRLAIVRGDRARDKVVAVEGLDQPTVDAALRSAVTRASPS